MKQTFAVLQTILGEHSELKDKIYECRYKLLLLYYCILIILQNDERDCKKYNVFCSPAPGELTYSSETPICELRGTDGE